MEAVLGWIGQIAEWFGQFIPRRTIVGPTEAGIKSITRFKRVGRFSWESFIEVRKFGPGMQFHWPLRTELLVHPVARQTLDLRPQVLTVKEGTSILIGGLITYRIKDVEQALAHTEHIDSTIRDAALSATSAVIGKFNTWDELKEAEQSGKLDTLLRDEARSVLRPYGVAVVKMTHTDLAKTRVIKLAMSTDTIV